MERIQDLLRRHTMTCVLVLCAGAAVLTGVWAVRTVQDTLDSRSQPPVQQPDSTIDQTLPGTLPDMTWEEDVQWTPGLDVAGKAEGIPKATASPAPQQSAGSASGQSGSGGSGKADEGSAGSAAAPTVLYAPPVSGSVIKAFSGSELVYSKTLADWRTHNGTDYACAIGSQVKAPAAGTVTKAETDGNWGGVVEITDAENRIWRVCGVAAAVKTGDVVAAGSAIGTNNNVHCEIVDGTHVHLELLADGKYIDPASVIG